MKFIPVLLLICVLSACSFDYGNTKSDRTKPDIVMRDVEYVRVRNADPLVRFEAEYAERYEEKKIMNLDNFSFDQFENHGTEINAAGKAGEASVELDSGNIKLSGGVRIAVETEDVTIETVSLQWQDKEKQLTGNSDDLVIIMRSDGTTFTGRGFSADARERTWTFTGGAEGSYVDESDDTTDDELNEASSDIDESLSDVLDETSGDENYDGETQIQ